MPSGVTISGYGAEQRAAGLANKLIQLTKATKGNRWLNMLQHDQSQRLVCRTLLSRKSEYISTMRAIADDRGNQLTQAEIQKLQKGLPSSFWVTEISVPNLYNANKHKLGDILTPARGSRQQFLTGAMTVFFWFPGISWHKGLQALQGWSLFGHIPILRGAGQNRNTIEW